MIDDRPAPRHHADVDARRFTLVALALLTVLLGSVWLYLRGGGEGYVHPGAANAGPLSEWTARFHAPRNTSAETTPRPPAERTTSRTDIARTTTPSRLAPARLRRRIDASRKRWQRRLPRIAVWLDDRAYRMRRAVLDTPVVQYAAGRIDLSTRRPLAALEHFERGLRLQPRNPDLLVARATALTAAGRRNQADAALRAAVELLPDAARVRFGYGTYLTDRGRFTEAAAQYRALLRIDPTHAPGLFNLANLALRAGRLSEAERLWNRYVTLRPDDAGAWHQLGVLYMDYVKPEAAADCFERVTRMRPLAADAFLNLGLARQALQQYERADTAMATADALRPCDPLTLRHRLALLREMAARPEIAGPVHIFEMDGVIADLAQAAPELATDAGPEEAIAAAANTDLME